MTAPAVSLSADSMLSPAEALLVAMAGRVACLAADQRAVPEVVR